jgi:hypothetical protein
MQHALLTIRQTADRQEASDINLVASRLTLKMQKKYTVIPSPQAKRDLATNAGASATPDYFRSGATLSTILPRVWPSLSAGGRQKGQVK